MEILRYLQTHLSPFQLSVVRLAIWLVILAVVFVPLERLFGLRKQKLLRQGLLTDLAYGWLDPRVREAGALTRLLGLLSPSCGQLEPRRALECWRWFDGRRSGRSRW